MRSTFVIKKAKNGEYHFNLNAGNSQVILSSELYKQSASVLKGIEAVKTASTNLENFEIKKSGDQFYFTLSAANNEIIGVSEMYTSKQSAQNGIESVIKNAKVATTYRIGVDPISEFEGKGSLGTPLEEE